jgi:hypothetical protein
MHSCKFAQAALLKLGDGKTSQTVTERELGAFIADAKHVIERYSAGAENKNHHQNSHP